MALTSSFTYNFNVEARNIIGYSPQSTQFAITAAIIPTAPTAAKTVVLANDVIVSWTAPSTNPLVDFGATISGYQVYILASDGTSFI